MEPRLLGPRILASLAEFPVVAIIGPRQCGKTTLARSLQRPFRKPTVHLDLELPSDRSKLADPELYLRSQKSRLVILDEIQRYPELFTVLRALVDEDRRPGRYLILGSASQDMLRQSAETLAGRIEYFELTPFLLPEILRTGGSTTALDTVRRLWIWGGYPPSFLAGSQEKSRRWRRAFIASYLERDLPQLGLSIPSLQLRKFWEMLAHLSAQLWNASKVAGSLGVSAPTARRYLDLLADTFIARQLQPFHPRSSKRLVKAPKVFLRDTGILHELLRIPDEEALLGHPAAGASWETFVVEQTLSLLPSDWTPYFYRTHAGAELDLVLAGPKGKPIAVEIKHSTAPKVTRGTLQALEETGCSQGYVVVPPSGRRSEEPYPLHPRLTVVELPRWIKVLRDLVHDPPAR